MSTPCPVVEDCSATLTATLVDQGGAPIPRSQLETLRLTLYNADDSAGTIINGRDGTVDVLVTPSAGVVIGDTNGRLTWQLEPADNPIFGGGPYERHVALFRFQFGGGKRGSAEVVLHVQNRRKVASAPTP